MKHIFFVLYDSIFNSVFESQVVAPLIERLDATPGAIATIITFEKTGISKKELSSLLKDPRITIQVFKKIPFLGTLSLRSAAWQLQPFLQKRNPSLIIARGALAGWIISHAAHGRIPIIVQARGLAAEEYLYAQKSTSWWHRIRAWQYASIEMYVYGSYASHPHVMVHTVSNALRDYLITQWGTPEEKVIVAAYDIPQKIAHEIIMKWRTQKRAELQIPNSAYVYVYNGSAHSWQCPEETVSFFEKEYKNNRNCFLLILSRDSERFSKLLEKRTIPSSAYYITGVPHAEIYSYLAAADAGLLFREAHCINWVSRPTKALEYQSVGLPIIHNNTIEMLIKKL